MIESYAARLHAERALLPEGWAEHVTIAIAADGTIADVSVGGDGAGAEKVAGPLVPAMPNLHSHAFQRAMAGLAEVASGGADSFWSWRDTMYRLVGAIGPDDVEAIAAKLFVELLKGGFGSIAEFHYLHHAPGGAFYADRGELARRILSASSRAGIGLMLLPVFYAHADFGGVPPNAGQSRFVHGVDDYLQLAASLERDTAEAGAGLGLAIHSLRAATPEEIETVLAERAGKGPIHIHVAEQPREVESCLAWSGRRPVEFLFDRFAVDADWCLVHATHIDAAECDAIAASGAVAGLCPATEANLGDGLFPATDYRNRGGALGIGTDSHVATGVAEELRTLEYGQRLRDLQRNRLADGPGRSVGRSLFDAATAGGARALGRPGAAITAGMPADLVVLDGANPFIAASRGDAVLDRWIFALGDRAVRDVMVRGAWQIREGRHARDEEIDRAFAGVLERLASI